MNKRRPRRGGSWQSIHWITCIDVRLHDLVQPHVGRGFRVIRRKKCGK